MEAKVTGQPIAGQPDPVRKNIPAMPAPRDTPAGERKRIPMSVPVRKLEVPDIPGYHLHWFVSNPTRLQRALDAGYEYVDAREMKLNPVGLGSTTTHGGNTDLGSQVSIVSGSDEEGQPERLVLMKIKQEWYEEDQKIAQERVDSVAAALNSGTTGAAGAADKNELNLRYVGSRTKLPALFTKKVAKAPS